MTDPYLTLVTSPVTRTLAKRLGLPRPARLERYAAGGPLVRGPVLVLGSASSAADADSLARALAAWDLDVRRHADAGESRSPVGAVVVVLTGVAHPSELSAPALEVAAMLRALAPGGRVITVSRAATADDAPSVAAVRQGVYGLVRSLGKELRAGATANGVVLGAGVEVGAPSTLGAVRFFASTRSAFVDGQLLAVDSSAGTIPADWDAPLAGRVAVVTGAARGIGAAIAETLARDGAKVVVVDVPAAGEALTGVANRVRGTALQLDVTADDAGARIVEHAVARHGRIDVVVHNAGIVRDRRLANMTADQWDAVLAVNITAQLRINEHLVVSGEFIHAPRIVALASTSGIAGNPGQTNYGASKAAVVGMVRATAPLLAPFGGTANAVAPGFIETEMTAHMPVGPREIARRVNSLTQGGLPIDVAETVAFLAAPQSGGIVGQTLRVCGQNIVGA